MPFRLVHIIFFRGMAKGVNRVMFLSGMTRRKIIFISEMST